MSDIRVRAATVADVAAIAQVHVQAWHETYRGLVPEPMLAALSVERNALLWTRILQPGADAPVVYVAERGADGIIGFGSAGRAHGNELGAAGEITAIYLLENAKRRGVGRAIFAELLHALAARGFESAGLWVLVGNIAARRFYEALGGRAGPTHNVEHEHGRLAEIAYVWDDLAARSTRER